MLIAIGLLALATYGFALYTLFFDSPRGIEVMEDATLSMSESMTIYQYNRDISLDL